MMMTLTEAEIAIYKKIGEFDHQEIAIQIENQPLAGGMQFEAPDNQPWCKVFIQYSQSKIAEIGSKPLKHNFGIISIQCFTPKNSGTLGMANLCEAWTEHLQYHKDNGLVIRLVHPPQDIQDDDFYAKILRAEFSVN